MLGAAHGRADHHAARVSTSQTSISIRTDVVAALRHLQPSGVSSPHHFLNAGHSPVSRIHASEILSGFVTRLGVPADRTIGYLRLRGTHSTSATMPCSPSSDWIIDTRAAVGRWFPVLWALWQRTGGASGCVQPRILDGFVRSAIL